jgi:CRISPR-associated endonuclease/helicase Cas3
MRTLVEQTAEEIRKVGKSRDISVHILMGGSDSGDWHLHPDADAVLVGTQDMLLSRALNRGYASPRARWPMEFALLNNDCLWVLDEVQLMDVGLATSAQMQQFREEDRPKTFRPSYSWWMSATLQPDWLKSVDTKEMIASIEPAQLAIPPKKRAGSLWDVSKPLDLKEVQDDAQMAAFIGTAHKAQPATHRLTLVIVNTVKRAVAIHAILTKDKELAGKLELVHSRFRPQERQAWRERFLNRAACSGADRIIVATQVVEAGVDISASRLIVELAPWSSLIQRFGRAARYGGETARVTVVDVDTTDENKRARNAAPYEWEELAAARAALAKLADASPKTLATFEDGLTAEDRAHLFPYDPMHLLLRRELDELFDTTPDLSGADLDISRFIRTGEERDCHVFWREVPEKTQPVADIAPGSMELCPVPFMAARDWLKGHKGNAWVWDYLDGSWRSCDSNAVWPGQTILVRASFGGYAADAGWTGNAKDRVASVPTPTTPADQLADRAEEQEILAAYPWKTIATHGREVSKEAGTIAHTLGLPDSTAALLAIAGRWHDAGKAHPAFQKSILPNAAGNPGRADLAKAPAYAWLHGGQLYRINADDHRPGFRHELASAMTLFSILGQYQPQHPALLGSHRELLEVLGCPLLPKVGDQPPTDAMAELLALSAADFDLLLYLVCAHHGKVRVAWHAGPHDQDYRDRDGRGLPMHGIREGDTLPPFTVADATGTYEIPALRLTLEPAAMGLSPRTGASWVERVLRLQQAHGPFMLAYMEALLRIADIRASRADTPDPLLEKPT